MPIRRLVRGGPLNMTYAAALIVSIMAHCAAVAPSAYEISDCEFDAALIIKIQKTKNHRNMVYQLESLEFACRCPHGYYDREHDQVVCQ